MRSKVVTMFVIAALMLASLAFAQAPASDSVMLVDIPDVSGSMAKAVAAMTAAEVNQLARTLRPGDVYARVPFHAEARLAVLQHVRAPEDVANLTAVVSTPPQTGGDTSIARGLIAGREAVERAAGNRRVVMVLASDGMNDPPDGQAAERKRLEPAMTWWRSRPATDRILVGIPRGRNRAALEALAKSLDARLVTLDEYKANPLVERAIVEARAASPAPVPAPLAPEADANSLAWMWALALLPSAVIGWLMLKKASTNGAGEVAVEPMAIHAPRSAAGELVVSVSANGQAHRAVVPLDELEFGTATLGTAGTVTVPGLAGAPVTIGIAADGLTISEDAGTGVRVNGEPLGLTPRQVGRDCRLTHRGVAVTLQLRRAGEGRAPQPIRVIARGRRR